MLGERLRDLRARHGVTQEEAVRLARIEYKYFEGIEAGKYELRLTTVERLAEVFGLSPFQILAPEIGVSTLRRGIVPAPHRPRSRRKC
jgi:transcriptional regulator with XRE-family HTH domain